MVNKQSALRGRRADPIKGFRIDLTQHVILRSATEQITSKGWNQSIQGFGDVKESEIHGRETCLAELYGDEEGRRRGRSQDKKILKGKCVRPIK